MLSKHFCSNGFWLVSTVSAFQRKAGEFSSVSFSKACFLVSDSPFRVLQHRKAVIESKQIISEAIYKARSFKRLSSLTSSIRLPSSIMYRNRYLFCWMILSFLWVICAKKNVCWCIAVACFPCKLKCAEWNTWKIYIYQAKTILHLNL